jgi:hypothetical protein
MQVRDMHNDAGVWTGFEVSNLTLTRRRACRIAVATPGSNLVRCESHALTWVRLVTLGLWSEEVFCEFTVDGVPFMILEPFGDNDCYWIVVEEPDPTVGPLIQRVRDRFVVAPGVPLRGRWLTNAAADKGFIER